MSSFKKNESLCSIQNVFHSSDKSCDVIYTDKSLIHKYFGTGLTLDVCGLPLTNRINCWRKKYRFYFKNGTTSSVEVIHEIPLGFTSSALASGEFENNLNESILMSSNNATMKSTIIGPEHFFDSVIKVLDFLMTTMGLIKDVLAMQRDMIIETDQRTRGDTNHNVTLFYPQAKSIFDVYFKMERGLSLLGYFRPVLFTPSTIIFHQQFQRALFTIFNMASKRITEINCGMTDLYNDSVKIAQKNVKRRSRFRKTTTDSYGMNLKRCSINYHLENTQLTCRNNASCAHVCINIDELCKLEIIPRCYNLWKQVAALGREKELGYNGCLHAIEPHGINDFKNFMLNLSGRGRKVHHIWCFPSRALDKQWFKEMESFIKMRYEEVSKITN